MNFKVLLKKPKDRILLILFISTFILTFVFLAIFQIYLSQFPAGAGLFDIKNAWNKKNMDKIIDIWKREGSLSYYVELMMIVNNIDFLFMVIYGTAVFSGLLLVARKVKDSEKLQKFYLNLAIFSWLSVIFDLIEGIFILIMLLGPLHITEVSAFGASLFAALCVIVLYSCVLIWIIGLIIVLVHKIKKK